VLRGQASIAADRPDRDSALRRIAVSSGGRRRPDPTANGCQLDEGSQHLCPILGHDLGALLYTMGVVGWYGIATVPLAILLLLAWTVWLVVAVVKNGLKERAGKTSSN